MANTYTLIASSTVGSGGAANIEFTSIPSTYTDLLVKISAREESAANLYLRMRVNGATSASYSIKNVRGTGSVADSYSETASTFAQSGMINPNSSTASTFGNYEIYVPNYANTSYNKSFSSDSVTENNATAAYALLTAILFSSTSAISSLTFYAETGDLAEYSTAYLYGIKNS